MNGRIPSCKEADEILRRLCNSHFNNQPTSKYEHARASIPADPNRDDDILMSNFIEWARAMEEESQWGERK